MAERNQSDEVSEGEARASDYRAPGLGVKLNFLDKLVTTGLGTGLSPIAPGTVGSLLGLLIYSLPGFEKLYIMPVAILIFFTWGSFSSGKMEKLYGHDPSRVVIDEIIGMWISLLFLPKRFLLAIFAFLIFRVLDILKPYPANYFDKREGGLSIMLDDLMCGVYTNLLLQLYLYLGK